MAYTKKNVAKDGTVTHSAMYKDPVSEWVSDDNAPNVESLQAELDKMIASLTDIAGTVATADPSMDWVTHSEGVRALASSVTKQIDGIAAGASPYGPASGKVTKKLRPRYKSAGAYTDQAYALEVAKKMEATEASRLGTDPGWKATCTFTDLLPIFLQKHRVEPNTTEQYGFILWRYFVPIIGSCRVSEVTRENVRNCLDMLTENGTKPSVLQRGRAALSAMFRFAHDNGYRNDNPVKGLLTVQFFRNPQVAWDMETFNRFWPHLLNSAARTFAKLQASIGARWGEMAALHVSDIDWIRGKLTINKVIIKLSKKHPDFSNQLVLRHRTKTHKPRTIDIGPELRLMLEKHIAEYGLQPGDLLFPARIVTPPGELDKPQMTLEEMVAECLALPKTTSPGGQKTYEHGDRNSYFVGGCRGAWCRSVGTDYDAEKQRERRAAKQAELGQTKTEAAPYLDPGIWSNRFKLAIKTAGIEVAIPMKNLRHVHAIALLDKGVPGERIAQRLGNSRPVMMGHYIVARPGKPDIDFGILDDIGVDFAA